MCNFVKIRLAAQLNDPLDLPKEFDTWENLEKWMWQTPGVICKGVVFIPVSGSGHNCYRAFLQQNICVNAQKERETKSPI